MREYPKMLFRAGELRDHHLNAEPIKIANSYDAETLIVETADEELAALEAGWHVTLAATVPVKKGAAA